MELGLTSGAERVHANEANAISWGAVRGKILCNSSEESELQCGELVRSCGEESEHRKNKFRPKQSVFCQKLRKYIKNLSKNLLIIFVKCVLA